MAFLIPAFDEAGVIGDVVRRALAVGCAGEVVVVDDGSRDGTGEAAREAGARVVRLSENRGKGVALRAGAAATHAPVLVFLDGDGQDDPAETPRLLEAIGAGADLVIGSRFLGHFEAGAIRWLNRQATVGLTALLSLFYGQRITDSQAGFRAVRRAAFLSLRLRARRYDIETETLTRALRAGLRVVEIPVSRAPRAAGHTKLPRWATGVRVLATIIRCRVT